MKQNRKFLLLLGLIFLLGTASGQQTSHFYNVDSEITVEGTVREIVMEPRYTGSSPFLVIILEEKKSQLKYNVEISPAWFFTYDFHHGEKLKVIGSVYSTGDGSQNIIARHVRLRGKTLVLRDKLGFPHWREEHMKEGRMHAKR